MNTEIKTQLAALPQTFSHFEKYCVPSPWWNPPFEDKNLY